MKIKNNIALLALGLVLAVSPSQAQNTLPEGAQPMIITPHAQNLSYKERTLSFSVAANIPYEVSSNVSWAQVKATPTGQVYVHLDVNYNETARTAEISFINTEHGINQIVQIKQAADGSVAEMPEDTPVAVASCTDNGHASSGKDGGVANTIDGNYESLFHTAYSGGAPVTPVSASTPAILIYNFTNTPLINYVNYVPRSDAAAGGNGNFGLVDLYVKCEGDTDYRLYGSYDFDFSSASTRIDFADGGLANPVSIKFVVKSGKNNYAACAEMEFRTLSGETAEFDIFADDCLTTLRDGVTADDIDAIYNPFIKSLATKIFEGTYSTDYRVAEYPCLLSVQALSDMWLTPGKYYDQRPGVTGITMAPGTYAVAVSGLPANKTAALVLTSWYNGIVGSNFDGGDHQTRTYGLHNGVNVIEFDPAGSFQYAEGGWVSPDYDALAYIDYHDDDNPDSMPNIKVHFINGVVNGYLSADLTNEEMHELTANAKNSHMDVVGKKVHLVWSAQGLHDFCRAIDGSLGYRQYIAVMDSLVQWEHDILGFTKYNRQPKNRTFAYVNYTYYMFQGGLGVSFHRDQESRVLNCNKLVNGDDDAIWGLSHEWGHQHQMHPYFCWKGVNEVSNNMNSYYNIMKMGYRTSDKINHWPNARRHFLDDETYTDIDKDGNIIYDATTSQIREACYTEAMAGHLDWNPDYKALAIDARNITKVVDNKLRARTINEVGVGETLCPFIMLYVYFTKNGCPDFGPDLYESLRQMSQDGGSTVEKTGGYDKYELVAMAQNNNANGALAKLNEFYPTSVWCNYITEEHHGTWDNNMPYILNFIRKTSRLSGYNLFPYFEKWGFLRQVATYIGDYGNGFQIFPEAAYNEFKADMDALVDAGVLKPMSDEMVIEVSSTDDMFMNKPTFPN
ncbi:MAG: M60 family metallopeptidase [Alloprevotella sp.]|nr:M60 family metallopeptidase [Prevotellamassilia sp.]MDY5762230.1 M60 family metallopeptidase [Alloprevotella sp.]